MENIPTGYSFRADDKHILTAEEAGCADIVEEQNLPAERQKLYQQYAELIEERDELEEAIKSLGVQVKADIESQGLQKCFLPGYGTFSVILVPRWTYSDALTGMEEALKKQREIERENGTAQSQATSSLRFLREK